MTTLTQEPGELNIEWCRQDDFSKLFVFDIDLTGYTFASAIVRSDTGASVTITVTATNLAAGQITLSCDKTLLSAVALGVHSWYLDSAVGGVDRRNVIPHRRRSRYSGGCRSRVER